MIVDQRMLDIIRELHKELPILSYEELSEAKKLIISPDPDTSSIGQSMLYFSNFFERSQSIKWILGECNNLNDDGKTLKQLISAMSSSTNQDDMNILQKIQENESVR